MDTWLNGRAIDRSIRLWSLLAYRSSVVIIITHSGRRLLSVCLSGCLVTFTTRWGSIHPAKLNMYRIRNWWKCFSKFSAFGISASIVVAFVFFILSSTDFSVTLLKGINNLLNWWQLLKWTEMVEVHYTCDKAHGLGQLGENLGSGCCTRYISQSKQV